MFKFLDDAIDLLNGVGDRGRFVWCLLLPPFFPTRRFAMGFFMGPFFPVLLLLVPLFVLLAFLSVLAGRFGGFGGSNARCRFGDLGRGQGTARFAAARMPSASASGATPASRGGGTRWFG